jgi:hypothetical protein
MTAALLRRVARLESAIGDDEDARIKAMSDDQLRILIVTNSRQHLEDRSLPAWYRADLLAEIADLEGEPEREIERARLQGLDGQLPAGVWQRFAEREDAMSKARRDRLERLQAWLDRV